MSSSSSSSSRVSMQSAQLLAIPLTDEERGESLGLLARFPDETLLRILSFLPINDVVGLSDVSQYFMLLLRDRDIVGSLYTIDSMGCSGLREFAQRIEDAKKTYLGCSSFTSPSAIPTIIAKQTLAAVNREAQHKIGDTALVATVARAFSSRLSASEGRMGVVYHREAQAPKRRFSNTVSLNPLIANLFRSQMSNSADKMNQRMSLKRKREYLRF